MSEHEQAWNRKEIAMRVEVAGMTFTVQSGIDYAVPQFDPKSALGIQAAAAIEAARIARAGGR